MKSKFVPNVLKSASHFFSAARKYLKDNYPFLLDTYYKAGEYFDSDLKRIREVDEAYWNAQKVGNYLP